MASGNVAPGLPNLGKTYHGGTPSSIGRSVTLEGTECLFQDGVDQPAKPDTKRSGRTRLARLVRNTSGGALLPKRVVKWETGYRGTRVDGYTATTAAEAAGVVDDQLPAAGVADDDLFWIFRKGPTIVKTGITSEVIADGDLLVAKTGAGTASGRPLVGTAATSEHVLNRIGKAMSAATAGNTDSDLLVDLDIIN